MQHGVGKPANLKIQKQYNEAVGTCEQHKQEKPRGHPKQRWLDAVKRDELETRMEWRPKLCEWQGRVEEISIDCKTNCSVKAKKISKLYFIL